MFEDGIKSCPPAPYGDPHAGYFAIDTSNLNWERCRESFAAHFTANQPGIFFACRTATPGVPMDVASFLLKTEEIIGLSSFELPYSSFLRSDKERIIWVRPSAFWMVCEMRRQAFTIFLRAGLNYIGEKNNYEEALWGEHCARESKRAIMRFLFGYVRYIPDKDEKVGWVNIFGHKDDDAIRKSLVLPVGRKEEYCVIGAGQLWHS
jgi:hypothetical protein